MNKLIRLLLIPLLLLSCNDKKTDLTKLDSMSWILGFWEMSSPQGKVTESWVRTNDSTYSGIGKFIDSADKVLSAEDIQIVLRGKQLLYIPVVSNQNNGLGVVFTESYFSDTMVVFENAGHDFPQKITYMKTSGNTMLAYIEGNIEGKAQRIDYPYVKQ